MVHNNTCAVMVGRLRGRSILSQIQRGFKKAVFITGCDSGLGFSLARRSHEAGLTVFAGCLKKEEGSKTLADMGVTIVPLDVTKVDSVILAASTVADAIKTQNLEMQAVVNNAGVLVFGEFEWQNTRLVHHQVAVNLLGTLNVAHEFLPLLRNHRGRLINIVSHCALAGLPGLSVYGATKAAILNWSNCLRIEQAKYGVKIISFIPGQFFGESNIFSRQEYYANEMYGEMSAETKAVHGKYFEDVQRYLSNIPRPKGLVEVTDNTLYDKYFHALLDTSPYSLYKHEPLRYTLYHTLFKISPVRIRDYLVEKFASLPIYNKEHYGKT